MMLGKRAIRSFQSRAGVSKVLTVTILLIITVFGFVVASGFHNLKAISVPSHTTATYGKEL